MTVWSTGKSWGLDDQNLTEDTDFVGLEAPEKVYTIGGKAQCTFSQTRCNAVGPGVCPEVISEVFLATEATMNGRDEVVLVLSTCPLHVSAVRDFEKLRGKVFTLPFSQVVSGWKPLNVAIIN